MELEEKSTWTKDMLREYIIQHNIPVKNINRLKKVELLEIAIRSPIKRHVQKNIEEKDYLSKVPPEILRSISSNLSLSDVLALSQSNKKALQSLLNSQVFWSQRYKKDLEPTFKEFTPKNITKTSYMNDSIKKYIEDYLRYYMSKKIGARENIVQIYTFLVENDDIIPTFLERNTHIHKTMYDQAVALSQNGYVMEEPNASYYINKFIELYPLESL
jgi:hypothetical protein